jgi:hypothetical protein
MFACFAFAAALTAAPMEAIPSLSAEVSEGARALIVMTREPQTPAAFGAALTDFADDSMALSVALREAGAAADLPCIFKGIAEDARTRAIDLETAEGFARTHALSELRALLDDAILLAPQAAEASSGAP